MQKEMPFLKLKGETWISKEEVLDTFEGLVGSIRGVDVNYKIFFFVEGKDPRLLCPPNKIQSSETVAPSESRGA
jgi:hypothetical protein